MPVAVLFITARSGNHSDAQQWTNKLTVVYTHNWTITQQWNKLLIYTQMNLKSMLSEIDIVNFRQVDK